MTMQVVQGGEAAEAMRKYNMLCWLLTAGGKLQYDIPLNGGSQTRRDAREYWRQFSSNILEVDERPHIVTIRARRSAALAHASGENGERADG